MYVSIHLPVALSIHSSIGTKVVSVFWLLWIMLQWAWECRYLWGANFISFASICRIGIAGSYSRLFLLLGGISTLHYIMAEPIDILTNSVQVFPFLYVYPFQHLSLVFLITASLTSVGWHFVVLVCIYQVTSDVECFSYTYWQLFCLIWRNVYSSSLPF